MANAVAFHYLRRSNEFYFVYGDPNSLSTTPALFLKWIRYVGAPKGRKHPLSKLGAIYPVPTHCLSRYYGLKCDNVEGRFGDE